MTSGFGVRPCDIRPGNIRTLFHILLFKIDRVTRDIELPANPAHILGILLRRAIAEFVGIVPVFHENADDVIALLLEQQCGHGGIDAAGHADDDAGLELLMLRSFLLLQK